jgi:acetolactate synthase I/II/III large subunit
MGLLNEIIRMALEPKSPATTAAAGQSSADDIVASLLAQGVKRVYAVAGESYLALLNAFYDHQDAIQVITCRHEANAANMAEATGKLTQRPGVALVTRGPGAMHASIALHTAQQDATPLVLLVGQIASSDTGRNAFQELDYAQVFGSICKAVLVLDPQRTGEIIAHAFAVAMSGRAGPVIVTLPEDLLEAPSPGLIWPKVERSESALTDAAVHSIVTRLAAAKRPLLWIGGSGWNEVGIKALLTLAEQAQLPVVSSFRRKDLFDNQHAHYVGELGFALTPAVQAALDQSDLQLVIGAAVGDIETGGYTRLDAKRTRREMLHVAMTASDAGRVYPVSVALSAGVNTAISQISAALKSKSLSANTQTSHQTNHKASRAQWLGELHKLAEQTLVPLAITGRVHLAEVFLHLRRSLPADAIVANGAGNYAAWLHRYFAHSVYPTQLAPQSGAMGYGLGAGIAAALEHPTREVVVVAGDGCFGMAMSDLITAAALKNLLILVVNNGIYGTIRMHQAQRYPNRPIATDLTNPDFMALAQACGLQAYRVTETEQFAGVLTQAMATRPALIEIITDRRDILPGKNLPS